MKKFLVITAIFLMCGFVYAQNNSTTTQSGNTNNAVTNQTGSAQSSTVTQTGDKNDSDVDQFTNNGGVNSAVIVQTGNLNESTVKMTQDDPDNSSNSVELDQLGHRNDAFQFIDGHGDQADGFQQGNDNELIQKLGDLGGGDHGLKFVADQLGNLNKSYQESDGSAINGKVYQSGDRNEATQKLSSRSLGYYTTPSGGPVLIEQIGGQNYGLQDFGGRNLSGRIYQTGDLNESRQNVSGQMDEVFVDIDGDRNYTRQSIGGGYNGSGSPSNFSSIDVDGDLNDARSTQDGSFNETKVKLLGSRNIVVTDQDDNNNKASVDVRPEDSYAGDRNDVYIKQTTGGNKASVTIHGSSNEVDVKELDGSSDWHVVSIMKGDHNDVDINAKTGGGNRGLWLLRRGADFNELNVVQDGSGNVAGGLVEGSRNTIDIDQLVSDNLVGSDPNNWNVNDGVVISGDLNNVRVYQNGTGHAATVDITGNSNVARTTQR